MTDPQATPGAVEAVAGAARLLSRRAGSEVELSEPEDLGGSGRSVVARARMGQNPFSDRRSVVIKQYTSRAGDGDAEAASDPFRYEVASCQLFTALPTEIRPSPAIIAHDPEQRLLVLEDLGRSMTLADKLFGPDREAARNCLLGWARGLGRMQAATAGREGDFGALLRRLGEKAHRDPIADQARAALARLPQLLAEALGVTAGDTAVLEARGGVRLLGGTGFRAFSPSDTCPDNNLVTSRGVRFVDFEWGCFRDVVLDAAYVRIPFPGCASSYALPAAVSAQMLEAWRAEVAPVWPELDDPDVLESRLTDAHLLWVWWSTWMLLPRVLEHDGPIGDDAGRSPRISTALRHYWRGLGAAAAATDRRGNAELAGAVVEALDERFPDAPSELAVFPAFRTGER
ncbi:hypothetical protein Ae168Ps1_0959c [Pseudonocardia sp. Ae168_Ps1]|uniref:hypothetical protein n=1 Tax=unclassified Pseudonocardia TaxID=2619320 RepID=UPI00094B33A4|nr:MULTISPECIES: hypothetical protein [unclassified Pseudonocardia]OLL72581.1 hypothetical protein Ae150APs1_0959c [Pseudonocardia sp. Ae150A_Ps1]OLL78553.1 hypothetical protein Ae168Ps1_0959c [Pseudonocardia sp. Ae168_Ps1]OLL87321.1 hypothetical protein Ae263Ps1_4376 [Pseudonocardia sp. Ae263_Ps1]OLL92649.1 hypothetical protein Ae356Ps1_2546c [Pseudonocardia sp. Ae356_Ps1]